MDYIKSFDIDFLKISGLESWNNLKKYLTQENGIVIFLILYISIISIYSPRHIISLINLPIIKILSLLLIIYTFSINPKISILLTIAFLITINLENSIQFIENYSDKHSSCKAKKQNSIGTEANEEESDDETEVEEESDDETDAEEESDDETDAEEEESDNETDGGEEESDDEEKKDEFAQYNEGFNINNIKPARNLDDNFTHLHKAMHKLEKFISKK